MPRMGAEMNEREALKLALEALDCICSPLHVREIEKIGSAMKAIREALAQPEFVLNGIDCSCGRKWRVVNNTLTASEQPEQEPVATDWERIARVQNAKLMAMCNEAGGFEKLCEVMDKYEETTPPQRKPLTDEQIDEIYFKSSLEVDSRCEDIYDFARAIEAAHGIKE